ncbi:O-methyltransferase-domain-containing protein [Dendryphion nanum]|uniref:O-methyltransferase-domain-containing protein n=1 Tax=Dendryphion nanum TaxID=256645 RepID=A0A9P9ILU5_9PLEO|nr:O-methyltransferase-domain-containing protein [Dendryphion nanum]
MADLVKQIETLIQNGPSALEEKDRAALVEASTKLVSTFENPFEKLLRLAFGVYEPTTLRIAVDLNLPDVALAHNAPISIAEFAEKTGADPALLLRILRVIVNLGVFTEDASGKYLPTPFTPVLATGSPVKEALVHLTHLHRSVTGMPEYFAANGYQNPDDSENGPFQFALDCKGETYFTWVVKPGNERLSKAFNATMQMQKGEEDDTFVPAYPVQERIKNEDPDRVLIVDVGGNVGHQLIKFKEKYPSIPGKLVLQDLPQVVNSEEAKVPESIIKVGHDFFKPQPDLVRGAKSYYLRMILHDWAEKQAKIILGNIASAMADDSLVLIDEIIVPESGVGLMEAKMDWHMLNMGASERTEAQWRALGESVGLRLNEIFWAASASIGRRGVLEFVKA